MAGTCFIRYPHLLLQQSKNDSLPQSVRDKALKNLNFSNKLSKSLQEYAAIDQAAKDSAAAAKAYRENAEAQGLPTFGYGQGIQPPESGSLPALSLPNFRCQIWDTLNASAVVGVEDAPRGEGSAEIRITNFQWPETGPAPDAYTADADSRETFNNFKVAYKLFSEVFKRDSLDGKGMPIIGFIHFGHPDGDVYDNAYWTQDFQRMYFGAGQQVLLDTIGHELMHGVTGFCVPKLGGSGEAGALNESISDCFGCMVKQYAPVVLRNEEAETIEKADWCIWDPTDGKSPYKVLRNLKDPEAISGHPKHMNAFIPRSSDPPSDDNDFHGIHSNCDIPSHVFYLACDMLRNEYPYAWDRIGPVWFHTVADGAMNNNAKNLTFAEFAQITYEVAKGLYQNEPKIAKTVRQAWDQVGITLSE
ncbi:Fc.00g045300.m01.CDS01 [Cosmosporella sp. VM-42]